MANVHDSGYKLLFSNRTIFRQLMESFVDQSWVRQLDFSQAEKVEKSFVSEHYKESESDLIYRLPYGEGELYVYILLEFQSTVDRMMALRVLNYVTNFYMDLSAASQHTGKLPPVFPIVLYNGDERWNAPEDINDLIESVPDLGDYRLHYRYFKIAENEFSLEQLLGIQNIVSTLFVAESHYDIDLLAHELLTLFDREEDKQAVSLFLNWFRQLATYGYIESTDFDSLEKVYHSSEEVRSMLVVALEREKKEIFQEGIEQGIEQGRAEGEEARNRQIALAMIERNFAVEMIADLLAISVEEVERLVREDRPRQDTPQNESESSS